MIGIDWPGYLYGLKIMAAIIVFILLLYVILRLSSAAIFRSYFQMKDKFNHQKRRDNAQKP